MREGGERGREKKSVGWEGGKERREERVEGRGRMSGGMKGRPVEGSDEEKRERERRKADKERG